MKKEIDCRKMDCPAPVLETKKCIEQHAPDKIRVLVDNDAALENVSRFLTFNGFEVGVDSTPEYSAVDGTRAPGAAGPDRDPEKGTAKSAVPDTEQKIMVMIGSDRLGLGDDDLGKKLMINFIKTLREMGEGLWRLVFVNHGVRLATDDSPVLEELAAFEKEGRTILVCGTCLTHLGLMEKKAVGQTTNMLDIVTAMEYADKVINL